MVQQEVKRLRHEMSSKMGSITEAEHVHELERTNRISFDVIFDEELKKWAKEGDFWVCSCDSPSAGFPPIKAGEKSVVQPYFTDILKQFNTFKTDRVTGNLLRTVYRKNPRTGRYTDKIYLEESAVQSVPLLDTENTPTLGSRKPDIPCYYLSVNQLSLLRMVTFVECKPRSATTGMPAFSPAEVGQVICTAELLLDKQPQRAFAIVGLSDGVRFQFFRVGRDGGTSKVLVSCMFMNMDGWAVCYAFDCFKDMHLLSVDFFSHCRSCLVCCCRSRTSLDFGTLSWPMTGSCEASSGRARTAPCILSRKRMGLSTP